MDTWCIGFLRTGWSKKSVLVSCLRSSDHPFHMQAFSLLPFPLEPSWKIHGVVCTVLHDTNRCWEVGNFVNLGWTFRTSWTWWADCVTLFCEGVQFNFWLLLEVFSMVLNSVNLILYAQVIGITAAALVHNQCTSTSLVLERKSN
jgi:hypothetical protein